MADFRHFVDDFGIPREGKMVPDAGLTSNRLFEVLADWNQLLQHTSFRFGSPINGNEWEEDSPADEIERPYRKRRKRA